MSDVPERPDPDLLREALGVYIGPATLREAVSAILRHQGTGGGASYALLLDGPAPGEHVLSSTRADLDLVVPDLESNDPTAGDLPDRVVLVFGSLNSLSAGNPRVVLDAPLVLDVSMLAELQGLAGAELHSGGVRFRLGFGPYTGHVLTVVFWQDVEHLLPSGDIAPGFGPFRVEPMT